MRTLFRAAEAPYCRLPITNQRRAYVPADKTTADHLAEVFRQHAPILACETERSAHLDLMGEFPK